jgi:serine/threonine-protein kinase
VSVRARRIERQLGGGYRIERSLGRGGMGEVWAARDLELECGVAIKLLNDDLSRDLGFVEQFRLEMKTLARFTHARIVRIKTAGTLVEDGRLYMVMERVRGKTLRRVLDEHQAAGTVIDPVSAAFYAFQIVDGLGAAHEHGIIHGDVKPENVMIDPEGQLTILDFGVARAAETTGPRRGNGPPDGSRASRKRSALLGTLRFMAPELIEDGRFDARSDLYAVGVVLVMMLTGEFLYEVDARDEAGIVEAHLRGPVVLRREKNPDCPEGLWEVALKLVARDPGDRYPSAAEASDALSELMRTSMDPMHPAAKKVVAERRERALRKVYEERGAPSRWPPAGAPGEEPEEKEERRAPRGVDATQPVRASDAGKGPCSPAANAGVARSEVVDVTRPLGAGEVPPPMVAPYPLAEPSRAPVVDVTMPHPVGYVAPRMAAPFPLAEPVVEIAALRLRPSRAVMVVESTGRVAAGPAAGNVGAPYPLGGPPLWWRRARRPVILVGMALGGLGVVAMYVAAMIAVKPVKVERPAVAATAAVVAATAAPTATAVGATAPVAEVGATAPVAEVAATATAVGATPIVTPTAVAVTSAATAAAPSARATPVRKSTARPATPGLPF